VAHIAQVDEQIAVSRGCIHDASNKFEEGKEFEVAAAERAKDTQLSEATRKKLQRRAQLMTAEVKAEFSKAVAQLRHAAHHYKHARGEIEKALRQRDRKVLEYSRYAASLVCMTLTHAYVYINILRAPAGLARHPL
jgi:predicted secreted protein